MLKTVRIARLLNDFPYLSIFQYEASGYPTTPAGVDCSIWEIAGKAGRLYQTTDTKGRTRTSAFLESIAALEELINTSRVGLEAATDPDVSLSSANPDQFVMTGAGNALERKSLRDQISQATGRLASRRALIYQYVLEKNCELKYSGIASDAFSRIRLRVDG